MLVNKMIFVAVVIAIFVPVGSAQTIEPATQSADPTAGANMSAAVSQDKVKLLLDKAKDALLKGDEVETNKYLGQLVDYARHAWDQRDVTTAESIFRQILNLKQDYSDALFGLAEVYRRTNPMMAVDYYTRYIKDNPGEPAAYYGRGTCYLSRDIYTLAIQDLQYLVDRLEPNHIGGLTNLALAYRGRAAQRNNDPDLFKQAVKYMQIAVDAAESAKDEETRKLVPDLMYKHGRLTFEYQQILAKAQGSEANFDDSIQSLQRAVVVAQDVARKDPENREALNQIVLCYDALSDVYNAQSALNPKDPEPYLQLAKLSAARAQVMAQESNILSLDFLKKAVDVDPNQPNVWFLIAKSYVQLEAFNQADKAISKAIKLAPDNAEYKKLKTMLQAKLNIETKTTTSPAAQ